MAFIGIISDNKIHNLIKKKNVLSEIGKIIEIKESNIENMKHIKFETVLIAKKVKYSEALKDILKNTKYLIINADLKIDFHLLEELKLTVITYGFNPKATVTISSTIGEKILICIQRNICSIKNNIIEPQEIYVYLEEEKDVNISEIIAISAIEIIYEVINLQISR